MLVYFHFTCVLSSLKQERLFLQVPSQQREMASQSEGSNLIPTTKSGNHQSSTSDIFSSAQVLAGAAKSVFSQGTQVDKDKVAEAGEDLLDAASKYGKLEEKGYGSYVERAEGFLHQFKSSEAPTHSTSEKEEQANSKWHPSEEQSSGGFGGFGGGLGDYAKGFFK